MSYEQGWKNWELGDFETVRRVGGMRGFKFWTFKKYDKFKKFTSSHSAGVGDFY